MDLVTLLAACAIGLGPADRPRDMPPCGGIPIEAHGSPPASDTADRSATPIELGRWGAFITEASRRFRIPEPWVRAVLHAESDGDASATSPAGAMGLMQIMPATYAELRERYGLGPDPYDPRDNILAGAAYLREMHDRFGWPGLFAAYNGGPERFDAYRTRGQPLPAETRGYLARIARDLAEPADRMRPTAPVLHDTGPLFVPLGRHAFGPAAPSIGELFVRLSGVRTEPAASPAERP